MCWCAVTKLLTEVGIYFWNVHLFLMASQHLVKDQDELYRKCCLRTVHNARKCFVTGCLICLLCQSQARFTAGFSKNGLFLFLISVSHLTYSNMYHDVAMTRAVAVTMCCCRDDSIQRVATRLTRRVSTMDNNMNWATSTSRSGTHDHLLTYLLTAACCNVFRKRDKTRDAGTCPSATVIHSCVVDDNWLLLL